MDTSRGRSCVGYGTHAYDERKGFADRRVNALEECRVGDRRKWGVLQILEARINVLSRVVVPSEEQRGAAPAVVPHRLLRRRGFGVPIGSQEPLRLRHPHLLSEDPPTEIAPRARPLHSRFYCVER